MSKEGRSGEAEELTSLDLSSLSIGGEGGSKAWLLEFIQEEPQRFLVHGHSGKIAQTLGWMEGGKYYLSMPEGLFLLEAGRASLLKSSPPSYTDINSDISGAYRAIKSYGYVLRRTDQLFPWDIYAPNSSFRKSRPPAALGRVVITTPDSSVYLTVPSPPVTNEKSSDNKDLFILVRDGGSFTGLRSRWLTLDLRETKEYEVVD